MSKIGMLLAAASMMAAAAESNERRHYGGHDDRVYTRPSEPEWKRKQCKSCKYFHKDIAACFRTAKHQSIYPTTKACEQYTKRK